MIIYLLIKWGGMLNNFEQFLALAATVNIIDNSTHIKLTQLWNSEYPKTDLLKEDLFDKYTICENENLEVSLYDVMTFNEASTLYGIGSTTLRKNITYGRYLEGEVRKSGGTWLITPAAIKRLYPDKYNK